MSQLKDLLAQIEALQNQVTEVRKTEIGRAISEVKDLVAEYGLTPSDVFPKGSLKISTKRGGKVPAKYHDPATGATWSGRGIAPKWLAGRDRDDFLVKG